MRANSRYALVFATLVREHHPFEVFCKLLAWELIVAMSASCAIDSWVEVLLLASYVYLCGFCVDAVALLSSFNTRRAFYRDRAPCIVNAIQQLLLQAHLIGGCRSMLLCRASIACRLWIRPGEQPAVFKAIKAALLHNVSSAYLPCIR